jgi:hypothetical protein
VIEFQRRPWIPAAFIRAAAVHFSTFLLFILATQPNIDCDYANRIGGCNGEAHPQMSVLPKIQRSHVIISEEIREFCDTVLLERFANQYRGRPTCVAPVVACTLNPGGLRVGLALPYTRLQTALNTVVTAKVVTTLWD